MERVSTSRRLEQLKGAFRPWIVCFAASLLFFYEFIQGNMFASIADDIMRDFHIQADKMMLLSSAYYLSNVLFLFAAGIMLDRFSAKKTIITAMVGCVLSTFVLAHTHSFYVAFACRFVIGIATRWFSPKQMALVTGAIVTMAMSGGLLAQYPLMTLVHQMGWREALMQVSWLGVLMLVIMMGWMQDKPHNHDEPVHKKLSMWVITKQSYFNRQTFFAGVYASLMNMAVAIFGAVMGQLYLMQRLDITQEKAAVVNGMLFLGAMVGGPLIGWWSDKLSLRLVPLAIALAILYSPMSPMTMGVLFFLLGLTTSSQVISYALVAEKSRPMMIASSISLVSMLLQGGYIVYQNIFSVVLLSHGGMHMMNGAPVYSLGAYQAATMILPISFLLAFLTLMGLKETHCRQQHG